METAFEKFGRIRLTGPGQSVLDPIRDVAEKIVKRGITDALALVPYIHAYRQRQLSGSTQHDSEEEVREFLSQLERAKVIDQATATNLARELEGLDSGLSIPAPRIVASPNTPKDPFPGKRFGQYVLTEKIGEGGMGAVYRAERKDGNLGFVVKLLQPLADTASYIRFRREGEVMAALAHPNVVRVYEMGEQNGVCYIVMEYVDGPSLQQIYEKKGRFAWADAAKVIRQIALGLEAAHQSGVIHRDVKPQNVLFDRARGILKVADFGLAKARATADPQISRAGDILGSPAYIAPEQWGDHDVDLRADLFALGVVFYQLVTGVLPFRGKSTIDYARMIRLGKFEPVRTASPDVPDGVGHVVTRLLEKRREDRYPQSRALIADIERLLRGYLPDVPRLAKQGEKPERWVLLGSDGFDVGTNERRSIVLNYPSIADKHAFLERSPAGLILRDLDSPFGTRVNGMRVREIALKDGDVIEFGSAPALRYRAGANDGSVTGATPSSGGIKLPPSRIGLAPQPRPVAVHGLVYEALLLGHHPRTVLAMIELLDEETRLRRAERARLRLVVLGVAAEEADRAKQRGLLAMRRMASLLPDPLFQATHENLGADPCKWLSWWFGGAYDRHPPQVRPPGARARGSLTLAAPTEDGSTEVSLRGTGVWMIGRANEAGVRLADRSVSRHHSTIFRLLTRYAIKDEGSRFGTVIEGERRVIALLRHDDVFELGRARLTFRQPEEPADVKQIKNESGIGEIDPDVFDGLVEMRSLHVIQALIGLLDPAAFEYVAEQAGIELSASADLAPLVKDVLTHRRRLAAEALPAITKVELGVEAGHWLDWWKKNAVNFPDQVGPEGYGI